MDYICPAISFGAKNIGSAWLSIRPPQLAGTTRNDLLTTLIQRYERRFLVQHLSKPPLALTVTAAFLAASVDGLFHVSLDPTAHPPSAASRCRRTSQAHRPASVAPTQGDAALMILRRYCMDRMRDGAGALLVIEHHAEIAHVDPAFKELKLYNPPRDQSRLSSHPIRV